MKTFKTEYGVPQSGSENLKKFENSSVQSGQSHGYSGMGGYGGNSSYPYGNNDQKPCVI